MFRICLSYRPYFFFETKYLLFSLNRVNTISTKCQLEDQAQEFIEEAVLKPILFLQNDSARESVGDGKNCEQWFPVSRWEGHLFLCARIPESPHTDGPSSSAGKWHQMTPWPAALLSGSECSQTSRGFLWACINMYNILLAWKIDFSL